MYAIIRKAVLMEDEGRVSFITAKESREEAEKFLKHYCSYGYFSRSDFLILKEEHENPNK